LSYPRRAGQVPVPLLDRLDKIVTTEIVAADEHIGAVLIKIA
jgi:hypothetical protein